MHRPTPRWGIAVLTGLLAVVLTACGSSGTVSGVSDSDNDGYAGALLDRPYAVPNVTLTDTDGKPFDAAKAPELSIVFFGYTNCPDICQAVMANIASAYQRLDAADQKRTHVYFVTTDPARDTAKAMRAYLARFNPTFKGATGTLPQIIDLAKPLGIFVAKGKKLPSGGYEVDHTTSVLGLAGGRAPIVWTNGISPKDLADDMHTLLQDDEALKGAA